MPIHTQARHKKFACTLASGRCVSEVRAPLNLAEAVLRLERALGKQLCFQRPALALAINAEASHALGAIFLAPAAVDAGAGNIDQTRNLLRIRQRIMQGELRTPRVAGNEEVLEAPVKPQRFQILNAALDGVRTGTG